VHPGHGVLLPGRHGPAAPGVGAARRRGRHAGLVTVPGARLRAAAHDGGGAADLGGAQPQPQLLPHDRLPRGLRAVSGVVYCVVIIIIIIIVVVVVGILSFVLVLGYGCLCYSKCSFY